MSIEELQRAFDNDEFLNPKKPTEPEMIEKKDEKDDEQPDDEPEDPNLIKYVRKKRSGLGLFDEFVKKQRLDENVTEVEKDDEMDLDRLRNMVIVDTSIYTPLDVQYPIIDWYQVEGSDKKKYFKVVRAGGHEELYRTLFNIIRACSRDDLDQLWEVGVRKYAQQKDHDENKVMYDFLQQMFDPHPLMPIFNKRYSPVTLWQCFENCGVHMINQKDGGVGFFLIGKIYPWNPSVLGHMLQIKIKCRDLDLATALIHDLETYVKRFKEQMKRRDEERVKKNV